MNLINLWYGHAYNMKEAGKPGYRIYNFWNSGRFMLAAIEQCGVS